MEKHSWQKVTLEKATKEPSSRWGHASVLVNDQLVFFGGYADSHYMNDLWSINTRNMSWTEHETTQGVPSVRSNCTMHYDPVNNNIILFGGGGPNKKRYNSVHLLNWETKKWTQLQPNTSQPTPWERTYHSSELLYPFLIVYGGQGIEDMDDLWTFNLLSSKWTEIKFDRTKTYPCARRFHTSVLIENSFYVIAGCYGKYRCLSDVFRIDLSSYLKNGTCEGTHWEQIKLKGSSFLTRWGHTSSLYNNQIFVFGGRFSSDLQDIIVIDPSKSTLRTLKVMGELPRARRRHSSNFIGSCLIVFGGFNGEYFNDLHYINTFQLKSKQEIPQNLMDSNIASWVNNAFMADIVIYTSDKGKFYVHRGMIANKFERRQDIDTFIEEISGKYQEQELLELFEILYLGFGNIKQEFRHEEFGLNLYDTYIERDNAFKYSLNCQFTQSLFPLPKIKTHSQKLVLNQQKYAQFIQRSKQDLYNDLQIIVNEQYEVTANRVILAANSTYFRSILNWGDESDLSFNFDYNFGDVRIFQVLINYLQTGYIIVPQEIDEKCWMQLLQLAGYFCLERLVILCQAELITKINEQNCQSLLQFGLKNSYTNLSLCSGEYLFRMLIDKRQNNFLKTLQQNINKNQKVTILNHILSLIRFDLLQIELKKGISPKDVSKQKIFAEVAEQQNRFASSNV